jgi:hypothetical protein
MIYRGRVENGVIVMEGDPALPDGTTVRIELEHSSESSAPAMSIANRPAFGIWKDRRIDGLQYERDIRAEWDRNA